MTHPFTIRDEEAGDAPAIAEAVRAAFAAHPHGTDTEHHIVDALRRCGALTVSLVAEEANPETGRRIIGHVAFSPVTITDGAPYWYGLGPVSVIPARQRQGIGSALIEHGMERLRELGAAGCVVLGEPKYYTRFGFAHDARLTYAGVPPEFFLALQLGAKQAAGEVRYHEAFAAMS